MSKEVTSRHKEIARHLARVLDVEKPRVSKFEDEGGHTSLFILEAHDRPEPGLLSVSTVGLSDWPLVRHGKEFEARLEIIGVCEQRFDRFAEVVSTAAFCVVNSKWFCAPGMIFPGIVRAHGVSATMSDLYFARPYLWPELSFTLDSQRIAWLLAVPISESESKLAIERGPDELESLLDRERPNIFDLTRPSLV